MLFRQFRVVLDEPFGNLHGIERSAFLDLVADNPECDTVGIGNQTDEGNIHGESSGKQFALSCVADFDCCIVRCHRGFDIPVGINCL